MLGDKLDVKEVDGHIHVTVIPGIREVKLISLNLGIVKIYAAVEQLELGPQLGTINLPGNIAGWYLNVDCQLFFQRLWYGHYDVV